MSYKLNQKFPARRAAILARRNKDNLPHAEMLVRKDKYGNLQYKDLPGYPAYSPNNGTPMKQSNRLALMRYILAHNKERIKEEPGLVRMIRTGMATRQDVYGFHPTKGGSNHGRNKAA